MGFFSKLKKNVFGVVSDTDKTDYHSVGDSVSWVECTYKFYMNKGGISIDKQKCSQSKCTLSEPSADHDDSSYDSEWSYYYSHNGKWGSINRETIFSKYYSPEYIYRFQDEEELNIFLTVLRKVSYEIDIFELIDNVDSGVYCAAVYNFFDGELKSFYGDGYKYLREEGYSSEEAYDRVSQKTGPYKNKINYYYSKYKDMLEEIDAEKEEIRTQETLREKERSAQLQKEIAARRAVEEDIDNHYNKL